MLVVVILLSFAHIPSDVKYRSLKRSHTMTAFGTLLVVALIDSVAQNSISQTAIGLSSVAAVGCVYWFLHRQSPKSLGLGDVLLVLPLSFALAWSDALLIPSWQLAASFSGAIHAVASWLRSDSRGIPFAPHLLLASSVVLALNTWIQEA